MRRLALATYWLTAWLTAGRKISEFKSPLTYQTRCVSIFHDK